MPAGTQQCTSNTVCLLLQADGQEEDAMEEDLKIIAKADPAEQESLQAEVVPDPMEGEQTWPTEEELQEAEGQTPIIP